MQKISALTFLVLVGLWASAQSYNPDKVKPKALDQYDQAVEYLKAGEVRESIPVLQNCLVIDSNFVDAYLSLAAAYGQLKQYAASIKLYEKARSKDSLYFKVYQLPYSINLAGAGRFQDALAQVEDFIILAFDKRLSSMRTALLDSSNSLASSFKYPRVPGFKKNFRSSFSRVFDVIKDSNI